MSVDRVSESGHNNIAEVKMSKIRIGIVGVGNCTSSLLQGIRYYENIEKNDAIGLMHWDIGGFKPFDIDVVAAFDIDRRKVGKEVGEAIFAKPNCTTVFCEDVATPGVKVSMGKILDGLSEHMKDYSRDRSFIPAEDPEPRQEDVSRPADPQ